jgi:hypothetical protein
LDNDILQAAADNDTRSQPQRNHDALKAMFMYLLESGQLGKTHRGLPVQVIISMTKDQVDEAIRDNAEDSTSGVPVTDDTVAESDSVVAREQLMGETHWEDPDWLPASGGGPARRPYGSGVVYTATGTMLPIGDAMKLAVRCDKSFAIFDNHSNEVLYLGRARRLASEAQRLAMFAAHRGCSHPGCSNPALWAEAHHTREWAQGGLTDITHLAPACPAHHKLIGPGNNQWQTIMLTDGPDAGRCAWIPPEFLDPERTPMVNRAHHPDEALIEARLAMQARRKEQLAQRRRECGVEPPDPPEPPGPPATQGDTEHSEERD